MHTKDGTGSISNTGIAATLKKRANYDTITCTGDNGRKIYIRLNLGYRYLGPPAASGATEGKRLCRLGTLSSYGLQSINTARHLISMTTTVTPEGHEGLMYRLRAFTRRSPRRNSGILPYTPQGDPSMDRLPIEILQLLFEFFVADGGHLEVLCLVSRRWRDATAGYSKLWTYIHISRDGRGLQLTENSLAARVRKAVLESEGKNLHGTIDTRTWGTLPEREFNLALEECAADERTEMWRWETLKLDLGDSVPTKYLRYVMPQLRELTYQTTRNHDLSNFFPYTAVLSTLRVNGPCTTTWPATIRNSVQYLQIASNQSSTQWSMLRQFTSIYSLFLTEMADLKHVSKKKTIRLSQLRELRVAFPEDGFSSFHAFLQLPALTDSTLYTTKRKSLLSDQAKEVSATFAGILPQLEKLTITQMGCPSADALRQTLSSATHLKTLVLVGCGRWEKDRGVEGDAIPSYSRLSETFYCILEDSMLCPKLERC